MPRTIHILIALSLLITQVAHAQTTRPRGTNFWMPSDVQPVGGGEAARSTKYLLDDTIGEANVGPSRSDTFALDAGYRQTVAPAYIAMSCDDVADMGSIPFTGTAQGSATCTVTTDADAGYALSWRAGTNNSSNLVGHWKMDETTGTTAYDNSGYGNNGTHTSGPVISSDVPSNYFSTRSMDFDGLNDYIGVPYNDTLNITSDQMTGSAWVYQHSTPSTNAAIFAKGAGSYYFNINSDNKPIVYTYGTSPQAWVVANSSIPLNTWVHLSFTYDGSNIKIFINGVEDKSEARTDSIDGNTNQLAIGAVGSSSTGVESGRRFDGNIDDVRIYSSALSVAEIRDLASKAPPGSLVMSGSQTTHIAPINVPLTEGLVGHWKMDEPVAGPVADSSGYGNDGAPSGPTVSTSVPSGANYVTTQSLDFDGSDYVDFGDDVKPSAGITVSAWIRPSSLDTQQSLVERQSGFGIRLTAANKLVAVLRTTNNSWALAALSAQSISLDEWTHVTMTYQTGDNRVYINGIQDGVSTAFTGDLSYIEGSEVLAVAMSRGSSNSLSFEGLIDDVRIYNRALSDAEIAALYGTPQSWSVANTDARWGARLSSASDDIDVKWGTDSSSEKWLNVGEGSYPLVTRSSRTDVDGSTEVIQFKAEIGATAIQPAGTYTSNVVFTASAL